MCGYAEAPQAAPAECATSPGLTIKAGAGPSDQTTAVRSWWVVPTRHVPKPWGSEEHFALVEGKYCGKLLRITAGHALSLQLHQHKDETIALQSGRLLVEIGESVNALDTLELASGEAIRIRPGVVHRMTALTDAVVLEASTTELEDVVRIEDRYGRAGSVIPL